MGWRGFGAGGSSCHFGGLRFGDRRLRRMNLGPSLLRSEPATEEVSE